MLKVARRVVHRSADLAFAAPFDALWRARLNGKVLCLLYHRVGPSDQAPFVGAAAGPPITADELRRDLGFLRDRGARFMSLEHLRAGMLPEPDSFGVVVSFDDGFRATYEHGLPVVEEFGARATVFQVASMIGASSLIWEHVLYWHWQLRRDQLLAAAAQQWPQLPRGHAALDWLRLQAPRGALDALLAGLTQRSGESARMAQAARDLNPDDTLLLAAQAAGHEIGSHGLRHQPRSALSAAAFEQELALSAARLRDVLGRAPLAFSYPFGSHQAGDEAICARYFAQVALATPGLIDATTSPLRLTRSSWPGPHRNPLRWRRWLWTGSL